MKVKKTIFLVYSRLIFNFNRLYQRINYKLAVKVALTAVLSVYLCRGMDHFLSHPENVIGGLWCVMASIVVMQNNIGGTYKAIWTRFLGVLIGSVIGAFAAHIIGTEIEVFGLAIALTVILCSLLGVPDNYRIASLSVAIILLPWKSSSLGNPWIYAFFRFLDTCVGFFAAIIVSHMIWPSQALMKMRLTMSEIFYLFREYFEYIFHTGSGHVKKENLLQKTEKEIDEAFVQSQAILEEIKVEARLQFAPLDLWVHLIDCEGRLWEHFRALREIFNEDFSTILDEELKKKFQEVVGEIELALKDLSSKLKTGQSSFDYTILDRLQVSLQEERIRFRSTHTIKKYQLDIVEDYYVLFYQIRQILLTLKQFNTYYENLNSS